MQAWLRATIVVLSCLLSACGGGGGGSGDTQPPPSTPVETTSGLLPAAPSLGAVLFDRATDIRPAVERGAWAYRRSQPNRFGSDRFSTITLAGAAGAGQFSEVDNDDWDAPTSVTVDATSASVTTSTSVTVPSPATRLREMDLLFAAVQRTYPAVSGSITFTVSGPELRSPVRTNDRYVLLDRHVADSGLDVDGDNRADAADIALWRQVVGLERASLPDGSAVFPDAVRVDTLLVLRFTPSRGGSSSTIRRQASTWYAPGIGAVRSAVAATAGIDAYEYDEWITGFDGRRSGWGGLILPIQAVHAYSPTPTPETAGVAMAVQTGDTALVFTGTQVLKIGKDARIISSIASARSCSGIADRQPAMVIQTSLGLRCLARHTADESRNGLWIYRLDADGAVLPGEPVQHIDLGGPDFFASDGYQLIAWPGTGQFWIAWQGFDKPLAEVRSPPDLRKSFLQAFSGEGIALTLRVEWQSDTAVESLFSRELKPNAAGGVDLSWVVRRTEATGLSYVARQQSIGAGGGSTLGSEQAWGSLDPPDYTILADQQGSWLTWSVTDIVNNQIRYTPHGTRMGAGSFTGSTQLSGMDAEFARHWGQGGVNNSRFAAHEGRFYGLVQAFSSIDQYLAFGEFEPGNFSQQTEFRQVRRIDFHGLFRPPSVGPLFFDDRIVYLTDDRTNFMPIVVWR